MDVDLLQRAFGGTRFIYLRRGDAVAQAVSLLRAEQTNVWFETTQAALEEPEREPRFDLDELRARVRLVRTTMRRGKNGSPQLASSHTPYFMTRIRE